MNLSRFLSIKIISSVCCYENFRLKTDWQDAPAAQVCLRKIRFGNLLKESGDILLCPLSEEAKWIGSEHVAFLPCRKLKYRGILFVCVDFYSEKREEKNAKRIAEAFKVASRHKCKKLSCPENILYSSEDKIGYDYIYFQLESVLDNFGPKEKIEFVIETVVQKKLTSFGRLLCSKVFYDFSESFVERLPYCAQVLPHYRKKLKDVRTGCSFSSRFARQIRKLLTQPIQEKKALKLFKKLSVIIATAGIDVEPSWFSSELCKEMPWNLSAIHKLLKKYNEKWANAFQEV